MSEAPGGDQTREGADAAADGLVAEAASLAGELEEELAALEAALGRLEEGRYGLCEICGTPLPEAALEGDPVARRCPAHGVA